MAWEERRRTDRAPERIVPDACPELIVHLADRFARLRGRRWVAQPRAFLAGTLSRPWLLRAGARVRTLGIRFRPGSVTSLFAIDMRRATDLEVALDDLVGRREVHDFVRRLKGARHRRAQVKVAEAWLLGRLSESSNGRSEITRPAVALMLQSRGRQRIEAIAASLQVSRRRLERHFSRDLGIRPKLFARIVRLNAALARIDPGE
jgi:AraC-like DNA-binding protein